MAATVGARGQVTIEKPLRDQLGIGPGWRVIQRRVGDCIEFRFLPPRHRRSLRGVLSDPNGPHFETETELREAIDAAWTEAMAEEHESPSRT